MVFSKMFTSRSGLVASSAFSAALLSVQGYDTSFGHTMDGRSQSQSLVKGGDLLSNGNGFTILYGSKVQKFPISPKEGEISVQLYDQTQKRWDILSGDDLSQQALEEANYHKWCAKEDKWIKLDLLSNEEPLSKGDPPVEWSNGKWAQKGLDFEKADNSGGSETLADAFQLPEGNKEAPVSEEFAGFPV